MSRSKRLCPRSHLAPGAAQFKEVENGKMLQSKAIKVVKGSLTVFEKERSATWNLSGIKGH